MGTVIAGAPFRICDLPVVNGYAYRGAFEPLQELRGRENITSSTAVIPLREGITFEDAAEEAGIKSAIDMFSLGITNQGIDRRVMAKSNVAIKLKYRKDDVHESGNSEFPAWTQTNYPNKAELLVFRLGAERSVFFPVNIGEEMIGGLEKPIPGVPNDRAKALLCAAYVNRIGYGNPYLAGRALARLYLWWAYNHEHDELKLEGEPNRNLKLGLRLPSHLSFKHEALTRLSRYSSYNKREREMANAGFWDVITNQGSAISLPKTLKPNRYLGITKEKIASVERSAIKITSRRAARRLDHEGMARSLVRSLACNNNNELFVRAVIEANRLKEGPGQLDSQIDILNEIAPKIGVNPETLIGWLLILDENDANNKRSSFYNRGSGGLSAYR